MRSRTTESVAFVLRAARDNIRTHSQRSLPHEGGGIVTSGGTVEPLINQRRSSGEFYTTKQLVAEALDMVEAQGLLAIALYHSHPSRTPDPSPTDLEMMQLSPNTIFVIDSLDEITAYRWLADTGLHRIVGVV